MLSERNHNTSLLNSCNERRCFSCEFSNLSTVFSPTPALYNTHTVNVNQDELLDDKLLSESGCVGWKSYDWKKECHQLPLLTMISPLRKPYGAVLSMAFGGQWAFQGWALVALAAFVAIAVLEVVLGSMSLPSRVSLGLVGQNRAKIHVRTFRCWPALAAVERWTRLCFGQKRDEMRSKEGETRGWAHLSLRWPGSRLIGSCARFHGSGTCPAAGE